MEPERKFLIKMIFFINDNLFKKGKARDADRISLLRNLFFRYHSLFITDNFNLSPAKLDDSNRPLFKKWLQSQSCTLKEELEFIIKSGSRISANAITRGAERVYVNPEPGSNSADGWVVSLESAIPLAASPLYCLVENKINDSAFILKCMPPKWQKQLKIWIKENILRFEHGGGISEIKKIVKTCCHSNEDSHKWRISHVVVYDHDGKNKDSPSKESANLAEMLKNTAMKNRGHRLQRRSQENYIPDEALKENNNQRNNKLKDLEVYLNLPQKEKHFYKLSSKIVKNLFREKETNIDWKKEWFKNNGCWSEMTEIAEMIAAHI